MPPATANPETAARDQLVRELIAGGATLRAIALKLGISPTGAARLVKALGLRVRKVKPVRGIGAITFVAGRSSAPGHAQQRHFPDGPGLRSSPGPVGRKVGT